VDNVPPSIYALTPADGSITTVNNPRITFDVTDTYSGMSSVLPSTLSSDVTLKINGNTVTTRSIAWQAIAGGFRGIFVVQRAWTNTVAGGGFGVTDSTPFQWQVTATDNAGNTRTQTQTITIDRTPPLLVSAAFGIGWDSETSQEVTGVNTAIKLVFSEDIASSSVSVGKFTVTVDAASQTVSSAEVRGEYSFRSPYVYLTLGALASDAEPVVSLVGNIYDPAGNANNFNDDDGSVTASPMN